MDRRRNMKIRGLSVLGAAIVAISALSSAGLPPSEWLVAVDRWWNSRDASPADARPTVASTPKQDNVAVTVNYLRPSPVYDGEMLRGYEVYPGVRTVVFAQLGLQPGDIITSINDAPLNEPSQSIELFMQLMHGTAVVATVERKSTSRRITLDGALISADQERIKEASATNVAPSAGS